MAEQYSEFYVQSLLEAINDLQQEVTRVRRSHRILRVSNKALREQLHIAHLNDELMKELCRDSIEDVEATVGGLPISDLVEPSV